MLCRTDRDLALSSDHKASNSAEADRIERAGGTIRQFTRYDVARVINKKGQGGLAVSRAIGDSAFGELVPCTPEV